MKNKKKQPDSNLLDSDGKPFELVVAFKNGAKEPEVWFEGKKMHGTIARASMEQSCPPWSGAWNSEPWHLTLNMELLNG